MHEKRCRLFSLLSLFFRCSTCKIVNSGRFENDPIVVNFDSLCNNIHNSYECAKKIEKHQLTNFSHLIKRNNDKLILTIENNADVIFIDKEFVMASLGIHLEIIKEINSYIVLFNIRRDAYVNQQNSCRDCLTILRISHAVSYNVDLLHYCNGFIDIL